MTSMINTNLASLNAQNNLTKSQSGLTTSMQRLSSGLRINSAKDDAAGFAIAQKMTAQISGNDQASRNANDAISLTQTADGDLSTITDNLQRMRELAVQSANGSNSASDRASIDSEVQSLSSEIDRVAQNSSFNGNKLLDGSFTAQSFQVGANSTANDSITIAIGGARTSTLGGVSSSNSATLAGSTATTAALNAGDLTLNGSQVGASALGSAPGQSTASAFSIAAAINAVSSTSGVTATANPTTLTGASTVAPSAFLTSGNAGGIAAGTFSINGVDVGAITAGATNAGQGANVAAAINKIATQTGVSASADASTGKLTLTAADGRDINIAMNGAAAGATDAIQATAAAAAKTTLLAQTGLDTTVVGTQGKAGGIVTTAVTAAPATPSTSTAGTAWAASVSAAPTVAGTADQSYNFSINGQSVYATDNASGAATVNAATLQSSIGTYAASNGMTVTGTVAAGNLALSKADGTAFTVAVTNTFSATPGGFTGGSLSGASPSFSSTNGTPAVTGVPAGTSAATAGNAKANHGTVTLNSTSASGIVYGGTHADAAGFAAAGGSVSNTVTSSVKSIASVNVLTAANATSALSAIDGALATVNSSRAALGVYQNRFASVVSNLQSSSENLTASRSRIQDTDFAKETASMTRGQILQQAGTAMLAQANSLPNGVMALLR